jgi:hypothetical protein
MYVNTRINPANNISILFWSYWTFLNTKFSQKMSKNTTKLFSKGCVLETSLLLDLTFI